MTTDTAKRRLKEYFKGTSGVALAYSGGTDSAALLAFLLGENIPVKAYLAASLFQPKFETDDATSLANELGAKLEVVQIDVLSDENIAVNSPLRCYYCKKKMMTAIVEAAMKDGFESFADGTNASDDETDRPGARALSELGIISPLKDCGLTKSDVRELAREYGLRVWNKPSYSCLATRQATGERLTADVLSQIELAEKSLMKRGFSDFRVRVREGAATLQIAESQWAEFVKAEKEICDEIHGIFPKAYPKSETRKEQ